MDMWPPYIRAVTNNLPHGARKIAFDRFHVAKQFNEAVDFVRRKEHKALAQEGDHRLKNTKYHWLRGGGPRKEAEQERFDELRRQELRTARAWAIKETAADLWDYRNRDSARRGWNRLLAWMARSRLQPMVKLGQTVRSHLWGILNAVMAGASNSLAENLNNRIQKIKARANSFCNRQRMINAIYFHLGGLDLYPEKAALMS